MDLIAPYTVSFFGHRRVEDFRAVSEALEDLAAELICTKSYVEFFVGRNGEFDQLAASAVRSAKARFDYGNAALVLVLPYETAEYRQNERAFLRYYDEIEVFPGADCHFKRAIQVRNRHMIDGSDLCVFYVRHNSGGAYQSFCYAKSKGKEIREPGAMLSEL